MKKTFKDLAPNDEQLKRINKLAKGELEKSDVAVVPMLVIDNTPTYYDTIPDISWFKQALKDINGKEGVSFQLNHDIDELPTGRLFEAALTQEGDKTILRANFFTRDKNFIDKYLAGEVQAVSAGLSVSWYKCGICGNEWLSEKCMKAAEKAKHKTSNGWTIHWPGEEYDGKTCYLYMMVDKGDDALREVSAVYKGASKGILLKPDDAKKIVSDLYVKATKNLKDAKDFIEHFDLVKKAADELKSKTKTVQYRLASIENAPADPAATNTPAATGNNVQKEPLSDSISIDAHQSILKAQVEATAGKIAELSADNEQLNAKINQLSLDNKAVNDIADAAQEKLADVTKLLRKALAGVIEQPEKLSAQEAIEKLTNYLALALDLRTVIANRIGKLNVQLHGNSAPEINAFAAEMSAEKIAAELTRLEKALNEKFPTQDILKTNGNEKSAQSNKSDPALYKMR